MLEKAVCDIEAEINRLYIYMFKELRDMHKVRLDKDLEDAKKALEWAKGQSDV